MYKLIALVCFGLFARSVDSAIGLYPPQVKPQKYECEVGCYNKDLDMVLPVNVTYSPINGKSCIGYRCQGDDGWTQLVSCGVYNAPNCKKKQDFSLPYPDCCPKIYDCVPEKRDPVADVEVASLQ